MKLKFLILSLLTLAASTSLASRVRRGWFEYEQPDGTTVLLEQRGDEWFNYYVTRDGVPVVIPEATVAAISKAGLVVADASGNVYIYFDSKANETVPAVTIGDKVKVEAVKSTYGGVPDFKTPTVTKLSAGSMTYPEPKDLNPVATSYASNTTEFVQMTGTLKIDGNYTNIEINGVDSNTKMGSVSQPTDDLNVSSFDGKTVTVKGYFTGLTGSNKFINVVATEIALADPNVKFCSVSPATLNAKADATSASFSISSNADWTITCDNAAFTVSPASGSGDATVTVSFSANEGEEARVANIKVSCAAAGVESTVVLTQAKPASGDALTTNAMINDSGITIPQILTRSMIIIYLVSPPPFIIPEFVGIW